MNSEELELSLRTEFESYLKGFLAELRQEVSEFQKNFETEFEKHKSQTDEAVRKLVQRFESGVEFGQAFNETVIEHLRLARDEGATITAVAIGEAERLKQESAPEAEFDKLRDAINEISGKTSQSEILKSLVDHAADFTPRGAFFIVKNEHFVGWRAFGDETAADDAAVRSIQFPISADTVLADAIGSLATTTAGAGAHEGDRLFLDALGFGNPDRMYAIPLIARGRGVAVLYADYGSEGVSLNPEALETLVRVAGLTVELAAAAVLPAAVPQPAENQAVETQAEERAEEEFAAEEPQAETYSEPEAVAEEPPVEELREFDAEPAGEPVTEEAYSFADNEARDHEESPVYEEQQPVPAEVVTEFEPSSSFDETPAAAAEEPAIVEEYSVETAEQVEEAVAEVSVEPVEETDEEPVQVERFGGAIAQEVEEVTYFEPVEEAEVTEPVFAEPEIVHEYVPAETTEEEEFPEVIDEPVAEPARDFAPQAEQPFEYENGSPAPAVAEPLAEVASTQAARTKYRDRNVDLPIAVPEDERRLHNDARRFARLLVSEIKLYNEQKVADGRQSGDLYDRLREAIDRSRDMYDKRVQQPVADKFDYFHYELVSSLAEGDDVKLGASYPGGKVAA